MALPKKELSSLDFRSTKTTWIRYPKHGSKRLPPGTVTEFEWKDYCPAVFRHLQELDNIDYADYLLSVCGHETLREMSSPGKSGCLFYLSSDDRFTIKTLRKSDVKVLLEMLPNYYRHVKRYDASLLTKFYGLHVVRPVGGLKVYFVVMRNIFQSELYIHKRFDLKGSSHGRTVGKVGVSESTTFKDLDLDFSFHLDPLTRHRLLMQIKHDCEFLEAEGIMDYSLLLGIHVEAPRQGGSFDGKDFMGKNFFPFDSSKRHVDPELTFADICEQPYRPGLKLGMRMTARAVRKPKHVGSVSSNLRLAAREIYNVKLFIGIIDILQGYNFRKRIEHAYKSIQFDSQSISAVNPTAYSIRFQEFLCKVFPADDPDFLVYNW